MSETPARKPWFAPKRHGYGAGLPISWEGWTMTIAMVIVVILLAANYRELTVALGHLVFWPLLIALFFGYGVLAKSRTRGGWKNRWGKE